MSFNHKKFGGLSILSLFLVIGVAASTTTFTTDSTVNLFDQSDATISFAQDITLTNVDLDGNGILADEGEISVTTDNGDLNVELQEEFDLNAGLGSDAYSFNTFNSNDDSLSLALASGEYAVFRNGGIQDYVSTDTDGNVEFNAEEDGSYVVRQVETEVEFNEGVNMVSFPSKVGSYDVEALLADNSEIESVWRYAGEGSWEVNNLDSDHDSGFENVEGGHGYIIQATGADSIDVSSVLEDDGSENPSGVELDQADWTLIGHYEAFPQELNEVGDSQNGLEDARVNQVVVRDGGGGFTSFDSTVETGDAFWVSAEESISYNPVFQ